MGAFLAKLPPPQAAPAPPPPPDSRSEKERKRVELTMAKNDVTDKQSEYDKIVPDEASKRKIDAATPIMNEYISDKRTHFNYELRLFNTAVSQLDALSNNGTYILAKKYKDSLKKKYQDISKEYDKHKEIAFTNRRRFDDADPQEGTIGAGWFSSVDSQVLLAFWTGYIIFIGVILTFIVDYVKLHYPIGFTIYGPSWLGSLVAIVIITHIIIKMVV